MIEALRNELYRLGRTTVDLSGHAHGCPGWNLRSDGGRLHQTLTPAMFAAEENELLRLISECEAEEAKPMIDYEAMSAAATQRQDKLTPCCQVDVLIVDASNLLYRIAHMEAHDIKSTCLRFIEKLQFLRYWYGAKELHVVWEGRQGLAEPDNWRYRYLPTYKGTRGKDGELREVVRSCESALRPILAMTKFAQHEPIGAEGDDGFATLACGRWPDTVGIYSQDGDLLQLAAKGVVLIVPQRGKPDLVQNRDHVKDKLRGLAPTSIPCLKGLQGDTGDNIPGVPGIGPKIALDLICFHGNLNSLLEAAKREGLDKQEGETKVNHSARVREELGCTVAKMELLREHEESARVSALVGSIHSACEMNELTAQSDKIELLCALEALGYESDSRNYLTEMFESFAL